MNRPTTIKLALRHCPKAVDYYEAGVPQDRSIFAVGTAAHEILYVMGEHRDHTMVPKMTERLITEGRQGYDAEPPLPADAVFAGRDLALRWISMHGLPAPETSRFELGFAFHNDWSPAEYGQGWFNLRTDVVEVTEAEDEEAWGARGLLAADYKSAWNAGDQLLDSIQMRAQALALHLQGPGLKLMEDPPEFIAVEIRALRTGATYRREFWYDQDAEEVFERTMEDIELLSHALSSGPRHAAPGPRCMGCPYRLPCRPAQEWLAAYSPDGSSPHDIAVAYALAESQRDALRDLAQETVSGVGNITTTQGMVGYATKPRPKVKATAGREALDEWLAQGDVEVSDDARALLSSFMLAAQLGVTQIRRVARKLADDTVEGGQRLAEDRGWFSKDRSRSFGVYPSTEEADEVEVMPGPPGG